ncbi:MAG TPA: hypothetical protein VGQ95_12720 [Chthoniobacterales bacterium]|nr:hypothetical protein [Chthoniobacterales bacterium]
MAPEAILTFSNKASSGSFLSHDGPDILFYGPLLILLVMLAFFAPHRGAKWFRKVERTLARLAHKRALTVFAVGLLSLTIVVSATIIAGMPVPKVTDEFSYLLAADTFAHGRLTNPSHPLWMNFETFHTIQQPTYASKYPPGQGLILALGRVLGHPIVGVWLSTAVACAAICWMLMGWFPARWAIVGALLAVVHPEILAWSQRYWGGSLTLAGGALAIGGFRRVLNGGGYNGPRISDAALMALGMSVLVVCRPYEGGVMTLILLAALAVGALARKKTEMVVRVGGPVAIGLAITAAWMCYYNWRVTHDPFRMPQQVYVATYNAAPVFLWQDRPPTPDYHHKQMRDFHLGWDLRPYTKQQTLGGLAAGLLEKTAKLVRDHLRLWPLLIACAALPWALHNRWMRIALLIWAVFTAGMLQVTWSFFHYAAPAFGLFLVLAVQSLRHLRLWHWRGKPVGLFLARGCLILSALSLPHTFWRIGQLNNPRFARRDQIVTRLEHEGGKHLIIVRYGPTVSNSIEWVYNGADIDRAPVIWAREMDPAQNRKLLDYFKDRRVWLLQVDPGKTQLLPYSPTADPGSSVLRLQKNVALADWFCAH